MRTVTYKGFTLAEVLVASTISAFIAIVAVGALRTVSDSAQVVTRDSEKVSEVRFAARMLARDLANLYRDGDAQSMRLIGASQGADDAEGASLKFYMIGRTSARFGQPEGDVYEVEYILGRSALTEGVIDDSSGSSTLYRRLWPNPDENRPPGGILTPLAENIDVFAMRFSDGQQWTTQWPEEMRSLPQLIEVTLATLTPKGTVAAMETFTVNFPRLAEPADAASAGPGNSPEGGNRQGQPPAQGGQNR
ncbi:MAG: type II secretion system protein GspJ [Sedimentisphaerales bacterium]|jgi:general secretion pathway protein J|nr:type II secretion system protein GspJ [Sedimentisphaerales bacterium]